jgi:hypothetical protein
MTRTLANHNVAASSLVSTKVASLHDALGVKSGLVSEVSAVSLELRDEVVDNVFGNFELVEVYLHLAVDVV